MSAEDDKLANAITDVTPKLLMAMESLEIAQKSLNQSNIGQLNGLVQEYVAALKTANDVLAPLEFPEEIRAFGDYLKQACLYCLRAGEGFAKGKEDMMQALRANRAMCRAQEQLYPLAPLFTPVNEYFLEPAFRNKSILQSFIDPPDSDTGIRHINNARNERGGLSLYIPENLDKSKPAALVMALHGGTGHGSDMLWSWLREARSRGFVVISPTSQGDTWSIMGDDVDKPYLLDYLEFASEYFTIDPDRVLLAGMSDGATYALQVGLRSESPFTHIAAFSGVLDPLLSINGQFEHAGNRKIYMVHGTLDWMFPIDMAQMAHAQLSAAGADITYREITDLSHNFARSELPSLLKWLSPTVETL
jgi:phospholipase/carboxylesterase